MKTKQKLRNAARERRRFPAKRTEAGNAACRLLRLAFYCVKGEQFTRVSGRLLCQVAEA